MTTRSDPLLRFPFSTASEVHRALCSQTELLPFSVKKGTPNLPTNIVDFRGLDSSIILILKGWNFQAHGEFPGMFESSNVSRDNLSREIGRMSPLGPQASNSDFQQGKNAENQRGTEVPRRRSALEYY